MPDTRRPQGRRHPQHVVLALAVGATLCGMDGYKAIAGWVGDLGQKARERFGCRIDKRARIVPSEST
ncbi:transposase family protein, partial [Flavobacterium cupreum]|uniref:transposase family protein n=1 Tax=Flavobacterium cupreum TaxID=2133766 RepID=UPI0018753697